MQDPCGRRAAKHGGVHGEHGGEPILEVEGGHADVSGRGDCGSAGASEDAGEAAVRAVRAAVRAGAREVQAVGRGIRELAQDVRAEVDLRVVKQLAGDLEPAEEFVDGGGHVHAGRRAFRR